MASHNDTLPRLVNPLTPHPFTPSTTFPDSMCVCGLHRYHYLHRVAAVR